MNCYKCKNALPYKAGEIIGRGADCDTCRASVRCCYNCKFYDAKSYNECGEPQAERVVDKTKANFCDYFSLGISPNGFNGEAQNKEKEDALKKLNDLFK